MNLGQHKCGQIGSGKQLAILWQSLSIHAILTGHGSIRESGRKNDGVVRVACLDDSLLLARVIHRVLEKRVPYDPKEEFSTESCMAKGGMERT